MKGFLLDTKGDVVLRDGDIALCDGGDLLAQTCKQVVGTNRGEWFLNLNEGIDFYGALLVKRPDMDAVKSQIAGALLQVDPDFVLGDFGWSQEGRALDIRFTASTMADTVSVEVSY